VSGDDNTVYILLVGEDGFPCKDGKLPRPAHSIASFINQPEGANHKIISFRVMKQCGLHDVQASVSEEIAIVMRIQRRQ